MSLLVPIATDTPTPQPTDAGAATPTPSPSPAAVTAPADALQWNEGFAVAVLLTVGLLILGLLLVLNRRKSPGDSLVRSWLAIAFSFGLLVFTTMALTLRDGNLRSTLIGAVAASVGAAVTHYFASKANDQARQDVLAAATGSAPVPDLSGLTPAQVRQILSTTSLQLEDAEVVEQAKADSVVLSQYPDPGTVVAKGSGIRLRFGPPPGVRP